MNKFMRSILIVSALVLLPAAASHAAPILLDSGIGALRGTSYFGAVAESVGYRFTLTSTQTITSFGLYDGANNANTGFQGDGLLSPNDEVDLWLWAPNFDGVLLAISAPIPQSGADSSGFIYQSSYTPFNGFDGTLVAGTQYVVVARYNTIGGVSQGSNIDAFRDSQDASNPIPAGFVSSLGPGQYSGHGNGYQFPSNVAGAGFVGPNLDVTAVPEPGTLVLACLAAAGLAVSSLRRSRHGQP